MISIGQFDLPPMPALDPSLIEAHDDAQRVVDAAIRGADVITRRAFTYVQLRILAEAAASLDPVWIEREPVLLPPRRRFVSRKQRIRLDGVAAALRHLDTRVAMHAMGVVPGAIGPDTPTVLHAFAEAGDPQRRITNAGCVRATPVTFVDGDIPFVPPPAEHCARLLREAVETANGAPAPYLTRATWLMAAVFAVHPFVDGNGRTGRLLMHGLMSQHVPARVDWGTIAEFAARREAYLDAARGPLWPSVPDYDARLMEPVVLMRFAARSAIAGAMRTAERLRLVEREIAALRDSGLSDDAALVLHAVRSDRNAVAEEVAEVVAEPVLSDVIADLVSEGLVRWSRWGDLRPTAATAALLSGSERAAHADR